MFMNDEFKNEVFSSFDPHPAPTCSHCGNKPLTALTMLNPRNGKTIRMFKCKCGEQTWLENKA